jgi:50S ribosomal protein L16 3-hydroxylase
VFLLQGEGERRWQISAQKDLSLAPDMPLKILSRFKPDQEYVLKTGDMLYLPPGYAHHGVAEGDCLTWSIGFRAPGRQELSQAFLDFLRDEIYFEGSYEDHDLKPAAHPGTIDDAMEARFAKMLNPLLKSAGDASLRQQFLGRYLTEPKLHVTFDAPQKTSVTSFWRSALRLGIALDLKTRLLHLRGRFFMNGEDILVSSGDRKIWQILADTRALCATSLEALSPASRALLHNVYMAGYVTMRDQ